MKPTTEHLKKLQPGEKLVVGTSTNKCRDSIRSLVRYVNIKHRRPDGLKLSADYNSEFKITEITLK